MECLATGPFPVPLELPRMTTSWCGAVRPGTAFLHPDPLPRKPIEAETLDRGALGQVAVPLSQSADPRLLLSEQGLGLLPSWQAPPRDPCPPPLSPPGGWSCQPRGPRVLTWTLTAATSATS